MDRHESKVRFEPELYEALKKVADKRGVSFQVAIEEALRIWIEIERRSGAQDVASGMAAAALLMHDELAAALRDRDPKRKLRALIKRLERWIEQLESAKAKQVARGLPPPAEPPDPVLEYMADLLQQRRPLTALENALADHVRRFAEAAQAERWGGTAKKKAKS